MATAEKVVTIEPNSELARALEDPSAERLLLRSGTRSYRVRIEKPKDIWADYDPEAVRKALEENIGSWTGGDPDKLIEDIFRWRLEGSRDYIPPSENTPTSTEN